MIAEIRVGDLVTHRDAKVSIVRHVVGQTAILDPHERKGRRSEAPLDRLHLFETFHLTQARALMARAQDRLTKTCRWPDTTLTEARRAIRDARYRGDDNERTIREVEELLVRVVARMHAIERGEAV